MDSDDGSGAATCLTATDLDRLGHVAAAREFFWLDLEAATDEQIQRMGETLGFHPLSIEDSQHFGQRPKVERHKDHLFAVFFGAAPAEDEDRLVEVHIYFTTDYLVTIRRETSPELDRLAHHVRKNSLTGHMLLHAVLDVLVDSFAEVLEEIDEATDEIEANILDRDQKHGEQQIYLVRRRLVTVGRALQRQRAMFPSLADALEEVEGHEPETVPYFADVGDHLDRMSEIVETLRDRTSGAAEIYLAAASTRMNVVMKQFTVIAGIFLPLSVVVGFFGMNFGWMVRNINTSLAFWLLGVFVPTVISIGLYWWFGKRGWLREDV
jgi:magnesium transporter